MPVKAANQLDLLLVDAYMIRGKLLCFCASHAHHAHVATLLKWSGLSHLLELQLEV